MRSVCVCLTVMATSSSVYSRTHLIILPSILITDTPPFFLADQVIVTPVTASTTRSVTFDLGTATTATTVPVTTVQVQPLSAPPLSRTVPPPSISIVPLDQLSALGTALLSQQKKKQLHKQSKTVLGMYAPIDLQMDTNECYAYVSV